ncbi:acyl-CoA thioester hydrolase [Rhodoferax ferrireducens]|uniref:Acyl-CoA thioester hydrolase n=1 Tax=Rhodoferax ferrireducens TaxID=192843 RepID=A0ABU2CA59_9BURK|nr:acyl-CoA thioesterase [Rhodoferax ferrireducens]MDR7378230.1 acyl-CoA thioester hydrolase [Rhodoferax ferrireducens]
MAEWVHEIELVPAFHDMDVMEIVWHGHYVKYMEIARCALLACLDYDFPQMRASGYAWPIVDMRLKYVRPASFGQRIAVRCEIVEWESRLKINYLIRDVQTGSKLTSAYTIQVAVDMASQQMQYVCPPVLWERLGVPPC